MPKRVSKQERSEKLQSAKSSARTDLDKVKDDLAKRTARAFGKKITNYKTINPIKKIESVLESKGKNAKVKDLYKSRKK